MIKQAMANGSTMFSMNVGKQNTHDDNKKIGAERAALPNPTTLWIIGGMEIVMLHLER